MRVLALASYPVEAAATRFRVAQFVAPLRELGVEVELRPFMDARLFGAFYRREGKARTAAALAVAAARRLGDAWRARGADVLLLQREAMIFGPPVVEWLAMKFGRCPMVLDLDDATYVAYDSPTYGRLGAALKWFRKTDDLIRWARVVTCGNRNIAEYVSRKGTRAVVIPTVVDTDIFRPKTETAGTHDETGATDAGTDAPIVLGWIGTHSTFPFLESIFPVLRELAREFRFRLKVVGAGARQPELPGVEVEYLEWKLEREVEDFRSLDVGLYPLTALGNAPNEWLAGKSGFKAVQYMAVGVPFVVTPVGVCAEMGEPGATHLAATTPEEWRTALATLLSDAHLRRRMGEAGRRHALSHYGLRAQAEKLAAALREACTA